VHAHGLPALDLVEVDHVQALEHAQMYRLAGLLMQAMKMRLGDGTELISRPGARRELE
jgi:hypothetical protein